MKVREIAIPRPHARKSNTQNKIISGKKELAVPIEKMIYSLDAQHLSVALSPPACAQRMAPVANMIAQTPNLEPQTQCDSPLLDASNQRNTVEHASLLLDPALFNTNGKEDGYEKEDSNYTGLASSSYKDEELWTSDVSKSFGQADHHFLPTAHYTTPSSNVMLTPSMSEESLQQPASTLVSPPASSHDDAENGPTGVVPGWNFSRSSSEQSQSRMMEHQFTPESGPVRRASSSSNDELELEKAQTPDTIESLAGQQVRAGLKLVREADKESLNLIKELQAQELGLRKRGKA